MSERENLCGEEFIMSENINLEMRSNISCKSKEKRLSIFIQKLREVNPSIEYISGFETYKKSVVCRCKVCGNTWDTSTPDRLTRLRRIGCPSCTREVTKKRKTLSQEEYEKLVKKVNPHIRITGQYITARKPITYRCQKCGFDQKVNYAGILSEREDYCPKCNNKYRYNSEDFILEMKERNPYIEVLGEYISTKSEIKCRCRICGHVWFPKANHIHNGSGCPECNITGTSFAEQILLWAFRKIYGEKEVIHRDKSAIDEELDIYIPSKKIAIEPGGWFWHQNKYEDDCRKIRKCKEKGIRCIVIYDEVSEYEKDKYDDNFWFYRCDLGRNHEEIKEIINRIQLEENGCESVFTHSEWEEIVKRAKEQNIKRNEVFLLRMEERNKNFKKIKIKGIYYRNTDNIECECKVCGYGKKGEWTPVASSLLNGVGCPACAGNQCKDTQKFSEQVANVNPNIILLGEYVNNKSKILCCSRKCGHKWNEQPRELLRGVDCPICNIGRRVTAEQYVERMKILRPDLEILDEYKGSKKKIRFKCSVCGYGKDGEWETLPTMLYGKKCCPKCAQKVRWETRKEKYGDSGGVKGKKIKNIDTGEVYESIVDASGAINRTVGAMNLHLAGKTKSCGGYRWTYYNK